MLPRERERRARGALRGRGGPVAAWQRWGTAARATDSSTYSLQGPCPPGRAAAAMPRQRSDPVLADLAQGASGEEHGGYSLQVSSSCFPRSGPQITCVRAKILFFPVCEIIRWCLLQGWVQRTWFWGYGSTLQRCHGAHHVHAGSDLWVIVYHLQAAAAHLPGIFIVRAEEPLILNFYAFPRYWFLCHSF